MTLRAYAPASIGNFAAGFDLMGAALAPLDGTLWGDVVGAEPADEPSLTISGPFAGALPADPWQNLVMRAYGLFRKELNGRGIEVPAVAFHLEKNLPRASGLGSSAASVSATLAVCQALLGYPLRNDEVWTLAGRAEALVSGSPHLDNVLPCLAGGLRLQVPDRDGHPDARALPWPEDLVLVVVSPGFELSTEHSRRALPRRFELKDLARFRRQPGGVRPRPGERRPGAAPPLSARSAGRALPRLAGAGVQCREGGGAGGGRLGVHALGLGAGDVRRGRVAGARPRGGGCPPGGAARRRARIQRPALRSRSPGHPAARLKSDTSDDQGDHGMRLVSTRDAGTTATFRDAVLAGIAPGGGLWMPDPLPRFDDWDELLALDWGPRCEVLLDRLLADELGREPLARAVRGALDFPVPLVPLAEARPGVFALELFHGPTLAFKDFGARFFAAVLDLVRDPNHPSRR